MSHTQFKLFIVAALALVAVLVACAPKTSAAPEREETYNCQKVTIYGRVYLIQRQEVGHMRASEWRVVAGPLDGK
jgi:hypothetical protein